MAKDGKHGLVWYWVRLPLMMPRLAMLQLCHSVSRIICTDWTLHLTLPRAALAPSSVRSYRVSPGRRRRGFPCLGKSMTRLPGTREATHTRGASDGISKNRRGPRFALSASLARDSPEATGLCRPVLSERATAEQSVFPTARDSLRAKRFMSRSANVRPGPHPPHARHLPSYGCGVPHAILRGAARQP